MTKTQMEETIKRVVRSTLYTVYNIPGREDGNLKRMNSDSFDFPPAIAVWSLESAIREAILQGYSAGWRDCEELSAKQAMEAAREG